MKAILPFKMNYSPIKKLALINFEKKPDKVYKGLELQQEVISLKDMTVDGKWINGNLND